jgi:GDPmannose 4,6-dehydratase
MWLMLQQNLPQDFVLATGQTYSVRTFVEEAFKTIGVTIE